jgi:hypothetical protein
MSSFANPVTNPIHGASCGFIQIESLGSNFDAGEWVPMFNRMDILFSTHPKDRQWKTFICHRQIVGQGRGGPTETHQAQRGSETVGKVR